MVTNNKGHKLGNHQKKPPYNKRIKSALFLVILIVLLTSCGINYVSLKDCDFKVTEKNNWTQYEVSDSCIITISQNAGNNNNSSA